MQNFIQTKRLVLRQWCAEDLIPFAQLNADPRVREYFPKVLTKQESDKSVEVFVNHIQKNGWGFWAVTLLQTGEFIGFIGIQEVNFSAPFNLHQPAVEIGWRLAFKHWGNGYATEGAQAALKYAFATLKLDEIVSFTAVANKRSRHVMEKIGLHRILEDDFDHPNVSESCPLRRQVLYRLKRHQYLASNISY